MKGREVFDLAEAGDMEGAFNCAYNALKKEPKDWDVLMSLAFCFMKIEQWPVAYHLLHRVRDQIGPMPELLNNLAMNSSSLASSSGKDDYLDEAESHLRKAWRRVENHPDAKDVKHSVLANLALMQVQKCMPELAEETARKALSFNPDHNATRETLGYACLMQGKFADGFENYEFAIGDKFRKPKPLGDEPYWLGEKGGTLYLRGEQGIGDEVSYASVIPDAANDNRIVYECDRRLEGLFKRSLPNTVEIHGTRFEEERPWTQLVQPDWHALTGSLCRVYRRKAEDFPRKAFLVADPERRVQWKALLDTLPGKKVGIAWTGGLPNTFRSRRSFNLEALLPLLKTPGITWVSLQYKNPAAEIEEFKAKHGIEIKHWRRASEAMDYDETAALVSELDCVVTVTTALAHLCGALGKKAFVLVPKRCRWFYVGQGERHHWYESLELIRQEDKWPVERVAEKVKTHLSDRIECGGCAPLVLAYGT